MARIYLNEETTAPGTPPSGEGVFYVRDGKPYFKGDDGVEILLAPVDLGIYQKLDGFLYYQNPTGYEYRLGNGPVNPTDSTGLTTTFTNKTQSDGVLALPLDLPVESGKSYVYEANIQLWVDNVYTPDPPISCSLSVGGVTGSATLNYSSTLTASDQVSGLSTGADQYQFDVATSAQFPPPPAVRTDVHVEGTITATQTGNIRPYIQVLTGGGARIDVFDVPSTNARWVELA